MNLFDFAIKLFQDSGLAIYPSILIAATTSGHLDTAKLKINSAPASLTGTAIMSLPSSVDIELVSTFPAVK